MRVMKKSLALLGLIPLLLGAAGDPVGQADRLDIKTKGADSAQWMKVLADSINDRNLKALVVVHPTGLADSYTIISTENSKHMGTLASELDLTVEFKGVSDIYYRVETDQGMVFLDVYPCGTLTEMLYRTDFKTCSQWTDWVTSHPSAKVNAVSLWIEGLPGLNWIDNFSLGTGKVYTAKNGKAETP